MPDLLNVVRWIFDAARGYGRAAEMLEGADELLERYRGDAELAGAVLVSVRLLDEARRAPGALGAGARLALSAEQLERLRQRVEEARSEAPAVELSEGAEA